MLSDRVIIRSDDDDHVLFKVFRALYSKEISGIRPYYDHHHSELEISCIVSGEGIYTCEGIDYSFTKGDIFFHCGNDKHCFKKIEKKHELELLVFQFDQRLIWTLSRDWFSTEYLKVFMNGGSVGHYINNQETEAANICSLLKECFDECRNKKKGYETLVKAKLLAMLSYLVRYFYDDLPDMDSCIKPSQVKKIEKSMSYISKNLDSHITLDCLAKEANMCRSYYSTIFKELNGVSVWDYITAQRIDKAQHYLDSSDMPIIDISESCGFNNISNFNRSFKRLTGKTPREYRNCES